MTENMTGQSLAQEVKSWPTPTAEDSQQAGARIHGGQTLHQEATQWQTSAADSFRSRSGDRKNEQGLDQQARTWSTPRANERGQYQRDKGVAGDERPTLSGEAQDWPSPQARGAKSAHASATTLEKNSRPLNEAACQFSRPDRDWVAMAQSMMSESYLSLETLAQLGDALKPNSTMPSDGENSSKSIRRLNPLFSEWLMGLPQNWTNAYIQLEPTDFAQWERESSRFVRQLLSAYWQPD